jgi:hypothetical protein
VSDRTARRLFCPVDTSWSCAAIAR